METGGLCASEASKATHLIAPRLLSQEGKNKELEGEREVRCEKGGDE